MYKDLLLQLITFAVMIVFVYAVYKLQCWLGAGVPEHLCNRRFSTIKPKELDAQVSGTQALATQPKVTPVLKQA